MILLGEEIQALLGATLFYEFVPFVDSPMPEPSEDELERIKVINAKLRDARALILPKTPRSTPGWLDQLHAAEVDVQLESDQAAELVRIVSVCLPELRTDGDLSAMVGGVHLSALRSAHQKLMTHAKGRDQET
ncbi:MAG: hypothetical protein JST00_17065 [Deltaproteobacteria bacterium]|nr:hypothetical protein [Deltaproteobacteria bacterium]